MACMTATTRCPNSYQIRFSFKCVKSHRILVRTCLRRKPDRQLRLFAIARNGNMNGLEGRRNGSSWMSWDSAVDGFSGWSGSDGDERSGDSEKNRFFKGIVGAGVAGVIIVTGLTFAALSLSKRNDSRIKQWMEPLMTQQEVSLASDTENDRYKDEGKGTKETVQDDSTLESNKGVDDDSFSSPELNEANTENNSGDDTVIGTSSLEDLNSSNDTEATDDASVQEDLQDETAFDDTSVASNMSPSTPKLSTSKTVGASAAGFGFEDSTANPAVAEIELTSELKESLVNVEPVNSFVSDSNPTYLNTDNNEEMSGSGELSLDSSFSSSAHISTESVALNIAVSSQLDAIIDSETLREDDIESVTSTSIKQDLGLLQVSDKENNLSMESHNLTEIVSSGSMPMTTSANPSVNEQDTNGHNDLNRSKSIFESPVSGNSFTSAGIPAPSAALQVLPGNILVPAVVDQVQGQALAALQVLKVIEADVQPSDLCTRREYARWLVSASNALSRNTSSKVYPAMYIENVTELAFDDITPGDPDFSSIQGLAEAGLISSKLSRRDLLPADEDKIPLFFLSESPLSRQDLVSWKMALEKRQLPEADEKILYQLSGFIDIDKINPDAWPALVADMSTGEQGIIALAFGYTRLFQPEKPVTIAQAAIALSIGEGSDMVSEELARIEAEFMAENAVTAHSALVAQVENDINASFEKQLFLEREKINAVEKMAEEAKHELEKLRAQKEEDNNGLMKERAAVESEMEVLSRLRGEVETQLQSLMNNKVEISYEKDRITKLRNEAEIEKQVIAHLQYELEVERKALSMARAWAEDEAKRAREQAKFLDEARDHWERHGIKVIIDGELQEDASAGVTWLSAGEQFSVEKTVSRGENLVDKLKVMAADVRGKSREIIDRIVQKILSLMSNLRVWISEAGGQTGELKNAAISKARASAQEFKQTTVELKDAAILKARESTQDLQQKTTEFSWTLTERAKRVAGDCKEGVGKLTQKFKT